MESLNLGLFDIFGFVIPGGIILISLLLILNIKKQNEITELLNFIGTTQLIFYVITAYMIGFLADNISFLLYLHLSSYLRSYSTYNIEPSFSLEDRALLHFNSPENFLFIERWNALTTFSYNLSFSFLILSIHFFKVGLKRRMSFIAFLLCLAVAGMLLNKAHMYGEYYQREVKKTVEIIEQQKKALRE